MSPIIQVAGCLSNLVAATCGCSCSNMHAVSHNWYIPDKLDLYWQLLFYFWMSHCGKNLSRNNKSNENVSICSIKVVRPHFYSYVPSLVSKILEFFWLPTCISVWEMLMPTCGPCVPQQCIITQILDVICVSPLHTTIGFQRTKILGKRIDLNLTNGAQGQVGG